MKQRKPLRLLPIQLKTEQMFSYCVSDTASFKALSEYYGQLCHMPLSASVWNPFSCVNYRPERQERQSFILHLAYALFCRSTKNLTKTSNGILIHLNLSQQICRLVEGNITIIMLHEIICMVVQNPFPESSCFIAQVYQINHFTKTFATVCTIIGICLVWITMCFFRSAFWKKAFATNCTTIWLLPCVGHHVSLQIAIDMKALAANCATVWPFPCVNHHVLLHGTPCSKAFTTDGKTIGLSIWMNHHVCLELSVKTKAFITNGTTKWPFLSVNQHVLLQISIEIKPFPTHIASKGLFSSMNHNVLLQII